MEFVMTKIATDERILNVACELFSEIGYHEVTIKTISKKADVNIAAVNYHFGSKDKLYEAAWRKSFARTRKKFFSFIESSDISAEDNIKSFIKGRINAIFCSTQDGYFPNIMYREMTRPTFAYNDIMQEVVIPSGRWLNSQFNKMFKIDVPTDKTQFLVFSVISQCAFVNIQHKNKLGKPSFFAKLNKEEFILHISNMIISYAKTFVDERKVVVK